MNAPYKFPLKSRAAIADFLDRDGRYYRPTRYRFCWNVKAYHAKFDSDTMRKHIPDLSPEFDLQWQSVLDSDNGSMFWDACEDAARFYPDEWCSYPGNDQGEWSFHFEGRCGGWLVLDRWRGRDVTGATKADFLDKEEWSYPDLVAFYRGIVCADSDFTPQKASQEVEYQFASYRENMERDWKAERQSTNDAIAIEIAESRPDLAPAYL